MKIKMVYLLFTAILSFSCERTECCINPKIELRGKFIHKIPDCDKGANTETNCTEWLEFVNESEVDILYGGGDIVHRFTFTQGVDFISLEGPLTSSFKPIFLIKDEFTLERKENGDVWKKE